MDAQLPRRLANFLQSQGYDTIHTLELPQGNATPDTEINLISLREQRIVVTKDADFVQSFLLQQKPYKLLLISTGNIKNADLEDVFRKGLPQIIEAFGSHSYVELGYDAIVIHS